MQKVLSFCLMLVACYASAQTTIPTTFNTGGGSKKIKPDFVVDWSIGESTVTETYEAENVVSNKFVGRYYYVTNGILQPFDSVHVIVNPNIPTWSIYEVHFSPVPAADFVTIDFKSTLNGTVAMQLIDASGKPLEEKQFNLSNSTYTVQWNLMQRTSGIYFFKIVLTSSDNKILKQGTFRIEKIK